MLHFDLAKTKAGKQLINRGIEKGYGKGYGKGIGSLKTLISSAGNKWKMIKSDMSDLIMDIPENVQIEILIEYMNKCDTLADFRAGLKGFREEKI